MNFAQLLLIILILVLFGVLPIWPHSRQWGRIPSGVVGLLILVLLIYIFV